MTDSGGGSIEFTNSEQTSVKIDSSGVTINAPTGTVQVTAASEVDITAPTVSVDGGDEHLQRHRAVPDSDCDYGRGNDLYAGGGQRMVRHDIRVQGFALDQAAQSLPALLPQPAVLQMNDEDFPARFLTDLSSMALTPASSITRMPMSPGSPVTLYQPVQRIVHLALLDLTCESAGYPRLDPKRVESSGIVIRRVIRNQGVDDLYPRLRHG